MYVHKNVRTWKCTYMLCLCTHTARSPLSRCWIWLYESGKNIRLWSPEYCTIVLSLVSVYWEISSKISLNLTEIRLYLPCTDWFGYSKRTDARLIWIQQTDWRPFAVPDQSGNSKYSLIWVSVNKISKIYFCVLIRTSDRIHTDWCKLRQRMCLQQLFASA